MEPTASPQPRMPLQATSPSLALGQRRKIIFLYHSLEVSGPAFQWALEHIFRPGADYVTLLSVFLDEAFQFFDATKLWKVANEEISPEIEQKKKQERIEQEMEVFRLSLAQHDIKAQKVIMPEGDAKVTIIKLAQYINAEMLVMSANPSDILKKAVYGTLEDYLLKKAPCTVIVAKPVAGPFARRDSGSPRISNFVSPSTIRAAPSQEHIPTRPTPNLRNQIVPSAANELNQNTNTLNKEPAINSIEEQVKPSNPSVREQVQSSNPPVKDQVQSTDTSIKESTNSDGLGLNFEQINLSPKPEPIKETEEQFENTSLTAFQNELSQYQQRSSFSIDEDSDVWGDSPNKETKFENSPKFEYGPPLPHLDHQPETESESQTQSDINSHPVSEQKLLNSTERLVDSPTPTDPTPEETSISPPDSNSNKSKFKPPQPQPKVKSIIDSLPYPDS